MQDTDYMKLAISLAAATKGQTSPNPQVGAVIVKDGCIVGTGAHLKAGTPHAEIHALREAGQYARGAVLYVTLEPCSHTGRTAPCADAIIDAGIKSVFIACRDPNPLVAGNGILKLKAAGIHVETGMLEQEAAAMNEFFFHFIQTATPYVTMKTAVSFDGKTAAKTGDSKWITSPESRCDVHHLRHEHDAILTGIQTILYDNPQLTARLPHGGRNPIRVILDTQLRTPVDARIFADKTAKTIIYTGNDINLDKAAQLQSDSVEVMSLPTASIAIQDVLHDLGKRKIMSVLVEGGSGIHASFAEAKAFQQIILYMAPKIIGGSRATPFIGGKGIDMMAEAAELYFTNIERLGPDIKITAKPVREEDSYVYGNS